MFKNASQWRLHLYPDQSQVVTTAASPGKYGRMALDKTGSVVRQYLKRFHVLVT